MLALHPRRLRLVATMLLRYNCPREQPSMGNMTLPPSIITIWPLCLRLAPHELQAHTLDNQLVCKLLCSFLSAFSCCVCHKCTSTLDYHPDGFNLTMCIELIPQILLTDSVIKSTNVEGPYSLIIGWCQGWHLTCLTQKFHGNWIINSAKNNKGRSETKPKNM
jgi:hypothetical protein